METVGSRFWILSYRVKWVCSVWCIEVYRLGSVIIWTLREPIGLTRCETVSLSDGLGTFISQSNEGLP